MSRIIDFFSDLIWGGGNPAADTYSKDWTTATSRNTGSPVGEVAQPGEEFILSIVKEQERGQSKPPNKEDADRDASGDCLPVAAAGGRR